MGYIDPKIENARLRLRRSFTTSEAPASGELRNGELAANVADGVLYVGLSDRTPGVIPGASGITRIVALTQAAYDALATKSSTTLYVITAS